MIGCPDKPPAVITGKKKKKSSFALNNHVSTLYALNLASKHLSWLNGECKTSRAERFTPVSTVISSMRSYGHLEAT